MRIGRWSKTAASNNQAVPDGAPEGWGPEQINNTTRELMAALRTQHDQVEWLDVISTPAGSWPTVNKDTDTQITIVGTDFTTEMAAGRRIRIAEAATANPVYGFIVSSALDGADTEVVVSLDSGVVMASPVEVWVGPADLGKAAWYDTGAGGGLDADTVDGVHAVALTSNIGKNKVINGRFNVWQRGVSFTADGYTADRMKASLGAGGAATIARTAFTEGQTDVPAEPTYFLDWNQTVAGTNPQLSHKVEDVRTFAGQEVVFSFYGKCTSGTEAINMRVNQNFGSGGSSEVLSTGAKTLTTSWQRFEHTLTLGSLLTKTLGTDHHIDLEVEFQSASGFHVQIADLQLELGATASAIDQRDLGYEERQCYRYYQRRTYAGGILIGMGYQNNVSSKVVVNYPYDGGPMRTVPTFTFSSASHFKRHNGGSPTASAITAIQIGLANACIQADIATTQTVGNGLIFDSSSGYFELDAEIN